METFSTFIIVALIIILSVDINGEDVQNNDTDKNETRAILDVASRQAKNAFRFEGQSENNDKYGLIRFEDSQGFPEENVVDQNQGYGLQEQNIESQGHNAIEDQTQRPKKKRRRRRKPKALPNGAPGYGGLGPILPGPVPYPGQMPYPYPGYPGLPRPGHFYRPPRQSLASSALSSVTSALTSIAQYDSQQCVPRLLCEAAAGAGPTLPQPLQPLLTLLTAYNGITTSPLFVFGRAVFLGMTSKSNPGTCRYAYNQCPNDPEQLVHYLNNHNGGFFRFFSQPQGQGLEQFYQQLSGGFQGTQPNLQQGFQHGVPEQYYGLYHPQNYRPPYQPQGLQEYQQQNYQNVNPFQVQNLQPGLQNNLYGNNYGSHPHYGHGYPYQIGFKNKIENRIQNTKGTVLSDNYNHNSDKSSWKFPEHYKNENNLLFYNVKVNNNIRLGKALKFPETNENSVKKAEGFFFPGIQSNRQYLEAFEDQIKFDNIGTRTEFDNINDPIEVLYIVRGDGDPNNPEIVYRRPGQGF